MNFDIFPLIIMLPVGALLVLMLVLLINLKRPKASVSQPFNLKFSSNRRHIKDVKPGQIIQIEWYRIKGRIGYLTCLNNDPDTRKILLEITWSNHEEAKCKMKEKLILDYNDKELANFHLLNPFNENKEKCVKNEDELDNYYISEMKILLDEAVKEEQYERADEIQKKIDKFSK